MTELMLALEATKDLTERDLLALIQQLHERYRKAFNADPVMESEHWAWFDLNDLGCRCE